MNVTVAICTWNRAALLRQTLDGMLKLRVPEGVTWELIVVNNNSTDDTAAVLSAYTSKLPLTPILETKQGLSHARNRAVGAAQGDLILWTDDDELLDPEWMVEYLAAARRFPDAAFFGGRVEPWYESPPPAWVEHNVWELRGVLALKAYDNQVRMFKKSERPIGASMGFPASLQKKYLFNVDMGRTGNRLSGGEDMDVIDRMEADGHHGVWVGTAIAQHWIPAKRMTWNYVWEWCFEIAVSYGRRQIVGKRLFGIPLSCLRRWVEGVSLYTLGTILRRDEMLLRGWCKWAAAKGTLSVCRAHSDLSSKSQ